MTDILNERLYRTFSYQVERLFETENLSLIFNTDGVPLYRSSGVSIWPVYLVLNELPPIRRYSRQNIIFWKVRQGKGKPNFQTYFQPFIQQLIALKTKGIQFTIDETNFEVKVFLLAGTLDLQAKAVVAHMTQCIGQFGCISCEEPGVVVSQGKGHCRAFPCQGDPSCVEVKQR